MRNLDEAGPWSRGRGHAHPHDRSRGPRGPEGPWDFGRDFGRDLGRDLGAAFGHPGRRGRRGRGRGGDVRAAVLLLLAEQPRHGYDLIQQIRERSEGAWAPSPGSVYPVLQQLEDEGLVEFDRVEGRKTASLTDEGVAHVEEHRESWGTPWETETPEGGREELRELATSLRSFMGAWKQVAQDGTTEQRAQATEVLERGRKDLYRILAGDLT